MHMTGRLHAAAMHCVCVLGRPGIEGLLWRPPRHCVDLRALANSKLTNAKLPARFPAVEYGIIDRVLEPEDEEVRRVVRDSQMPA